MKKKDDAEEAAREAYNIFRGMKEPMTDPHWDDLDRSHRALLEWTVRYIRLRDIDR